MYFDIAIITNYEQIVKDELLQHIVKQYEPQSEAQSKPIAGVTDTHIKYKKTKRKKSKRRKSKKPQSKNINQVNKNNIYIYLFLFFIFLFLRESFIIINNCQRTISNCSVYFKIKYYVKKNVPNNNHFVHHICVVLLLFSFKNKFQFILFYIILFYIYKVKCHVKSLKTDRLKL